MTKEVAYAIKKTEQSKPSSLSKKKDLKKKLNGRMSGNTIAVGDINELAGILSNLTPDQLQNIQLDPMLYEALAMSIEPTMTPIVPSMRIDSIRDELAIESDESSQNKDNVGLNDGKLVSPTSNSTVNNLNPFLSTTATTQSLQIQQPQMVQYIENSQGGNVIMHDVCTSQDAYLHDDNILEKNTSLGGILSTKSLKNNSHQNTETLSSSDHIVITYPIRSPVSVLPVVSNAHMNEGKILECGGMKHKTSTSSVSTNSILALASENLQLDKLFVSDHSLLSNDVLQTANFNIKTKAKATHPAKGCNEFISVLQRSPSEEKNVVSKKNKTIKATRVTSVQKDIFKVPQVVFSSSSKLKTNVVVDTSKRNISNQSFRSDPINKIYGTKIARIATGATTRPTPNTLSKSSSIPKDILSKLKDLNKIAVRKVSVSSVAKKTTSNEFKPATVISVPKTISTELSSKKLKPLSKKPTMKLVEPFNDQKHSKSLSICTSEKTVPYLVKSKTVTTNSNFTSSIRAKSNVQPTLIRSIKRDMKTSSTSKEDNTSLSSILGDETGNDVSAETNLECNERELISPELEMDSRHFREATGREINKTTVHLLAKDILEKAKGSSTSDIKSQKNKFSARELSEMKKFQEVIESTHVGSQENNMRELAKQEIVKQLKRMDVTNKKSNENEKKVSQETQTSIKQDKSIKNASMNKEKATAAIDSNPNSLRKIRKKKINTLVVDENRKRGRPKKFDDFILPPETKKEKKSRKFFFPNTEKKDEKETDHGDTIAHSEKEKKIDNDCNEANRKIQKDDSVETKENNPLSTKLTKRSGDKNIKNRPNKSKTKKRKNPAIAYEPEVLPEHLRRKSKQKADDTFIDVTKVKLKSSFVETTFSLTDTVELKTYKLLERKSWSCTLCGKPGNLGNLDVLFGPYKLNVIDKNSSKNRFSQEQMNVWLHRDCAVWTSNICLSNQTLIGLGESLDQAAVTKCCLCSQVGATLLCGFKHCREGYHFVCAKQRGCSFQMESFTIICPKHR